MRVATAAAITNKVILCSRCERSQRAGVTSAPRFPIARSRRIRPRQRPRRSTATKRSQREKREVLQLTAKGHTNAEIATRLGISARTAETHRANLMHKLVLHTQADLIRYALRRGIISMES
ncbi:MAG TPA: LuxR C-terminal-related transcriptional regulator [Blastocatellia bacterium]|nr:LuxR C-terminal-related transcriptional regulator [Blastocatellia bacterium]